MPAVLKTTFQGEVRRVQMHDECLQYSLITAAIQEAWPELLSCDAKYQDADGDFCTLCAATMPDFLAHGREVAGHVVFRLELAASAAPQLPECRQLDQHADADVGTEPTSKGSLESGSPGVDMAKGAWGAMKGLLAKGLGKGFGKGFGMGFGKGRCKGKDTGKCGKVCVGDDAFRDSTFEGSTMEDSTTEDSFARALPLRKLLWTLLQLRSGGVLSSKAAASLTVHMLPGLISKLADKASKVDRKVRKHYSTLQPVLVDLQGLASRYEGLDHCAGMLGAAASDESVPASEAFSELLLALNGLPFDVQIAFMEEIYFSQEGRFMDLLDSVQARMPDAPAVPVEHSGVTCDGCSMNSLRGLCFTCQDCPDFDLCAECFAKRSSAHGGECAEHSFQCQAFDWGGVLEQLCGSVCSSVSALPTVGMMKGAWAEAFRMYGKDKGKGKGKGKCGKGWKGSVHCETKMGESGPADQNGRCAAESCKHLMKPWLLLGTLLQLRSGGALSSKAAASLAVHMLPGLVSKLADKASKVDRKVRKRYSTLQPVLVDLQGLASRYEGLDHCAGMLGAAASDESAPASEALSALLLALNGLSFDVQIAFMEEFYCSQEGRLMELLDWLQACMPDAPEVPVEHSGVTCDGCSMSPLRGLRFTCQDCPDFDLCAECFAKRSSAHGGECAEHSFQCRPFDWFGLWRQHHLAMPAKGRMKGAWAAAMSMKGMQGMNGMKGFCKGKGKGFGKGKGTDFEGCGVVWHAWEQ